MSLLFRQLRDPVRWNGPGRLCPEKQSGQLNVFVDIRPMNAEAADPGVGTLGRRGLVEARIPPQRRRTLSRHLWHGSAVCLRPVLPGNLEQAQEFVPAAVCHHLLQSACPVDLLLMGFTIEGVFSAEGGRGLLRRRDRQSPKTEGNPGRNPRTKGNSPEDKRRRVG